MTHTTIPASGTRRRGRCRLSLFTLLTLLATTSAVVAPAPAFADAANATQIAGVPFSATLDFSTAQPDSDAPNCTYRLPTFWYTYTAPGDQILVAERAAFVTVFTGAPGSLDPLTLCGGYNPSGQVRFEVAAGQTVYIAVSNDVEATGTFSLVLAPPPISVQLTLDARARLGSEPGTAIVSGTTTSNNYGWGIVYGELIQKQGRNVAHANLYSFYVGLDPTTPTTWTATVDTGSRLLPTRATLTVSVSATDGLTDEGITVTGTVKIRRH